MPRTMATGSANYFVCRHSKFFISCLLQERGSDGRPVWGSMSLILRPEKPPSNKKTPLFASRVAPSSMRIMFREEVVRIYKAKDGRRGRETGGHALFAFASLPPPPSKLGLNALPLHRRVQRAEKLHVSSLLSFFMAAAANRLSGRAYHRLQS